MNFKLFYNIKLVSQDQFVNKLYWNRPQSIVYILNIHPNIETMSQPIMQPANMKCTFIPQGKKTLPKF